MIQPEDHLDQQRLRHSELLRLARTRELAARLAAGRRDETRSRLERLRRERDSAAAGAARPAAS
jgi:hypothetical protein